MIRPHLSEYAVQRLVHAPHTSTVAFTGLPACAIKPLPMYKGLEGSSVACPEPATPSGTPHTLTVVCSPSWPRGFKVSGKGPAGSVKEVSPF